MKKNSFCFTSDKDYADVFSLLNKDGKSKSCILQMIFEIGCNVVKDVLKGTGLKPFQQPSLFDNDDKVEQALYRMAGYKDNLRKAGKETLHVEIRQGNVEWY